MKDKPNYDCKMDGKTVRCSCGGQVAVGATLHPLVDIGFGFVGSKFEVKVKHNMRKIIGYQGFCMRCQKDGDFFLPGHFPPG